jgi:ubiquinone/menaquinone biosynthesis C-methylase UbiE
MKTLVEHDMENERKWDRRAKSYDDKRFDYFRFMQKKAISQIVIKDNMTFLDLGCGTGWAVRYVSNLTKGNGKYWGIDISNGMIDKAKINSQRFENIDFLRASAEELPFDNDYFDNIICTNSFHHYLHPDIVLKEIFRVLKPDSRIYILDVTSDDNFISWINRKVQKKEKAHVRFYSTSEYKDMFTKSGLKHIKSKRLTYPMKLHIAEK